MLQEPNSDLLGHRKSFLSAGVTSGVRPSLPPTSERMLSEARLGCPGHTLAEVGGRTRSQTSPARQTLKNKTELECVSWWNKFSQLGRNWRKNCEEPFRSKSCCVVLPPMASASKLMLRVGLCFKHCFVLGICWFEKVQVQLLVTSDSAKNVKLSGNVRVSWDFNGFICL